MSISQKLRFYKRKYFAICDFLLGLFNSPRKQWLEDLVIRETMNLIMDDKAIEAIVSMVMDLQDRENTNLPLYEQQLKEAELGIQNMLNAIQQGILTKSTKARLEELEAAKEEIEIRIANEKLIKPKVSAEFVTFWLHRFRKLDVRQQSHRKMLIDTFVNAIYLYDDKLIITFNYKEGSQTVTFGDIKTALSQENIGSDLDCLTAPNQYNPNLVFPVGDGFGLFIFFGKFEDTHFRNGVIKRPESKPRGPRKKKQI